MKQYSTEVYRWHQRFWHLKRVNWNLGASHLPEVCWKGWKGRVGRGGKEANLSPSLFIPSFSGPHAGLSQQGQRSKTVEATILLACTRLNMLARHNS
jgi:hypothetical protein